MIINGYEIKVYANLRDANLNDANLSGATLRGADLCGANLCGANLYDANLSDANLSDADLCGANLRDANLRDANLSDANLSGATLRGADLRGANLNGANLRGANLWGTVGNMREIKSLQLDTWVVSWIMDQENKVTLQIGCQKHPLEKWVKSDPRWIAVLDFTAADWWGKYRDFILNTVNLFPATPYGKSVDKGIDSVV